MRAKSYLSQYLDIRAEIRRLERVRQELRDDIDSIKSDMTDERVQSSKQYDRVAEMIARLVDQTEEISKKTCEAYDKLLEIQSVIDEIEDIKVREVITVRYTSVNSATGRQLTWAEISEQLHRSERDLMRLHKEGLRTVYRIINEVEYE